MATKQTKHIIYLQPRDDQEKARLYQVDGHNYTVPCGTQVEVDDYLYNAIQISGDLNMRG